MFLVPKVAALLRPLLDAPDQLIHGVSWPMLPTLHPPRELRTLLLPVDPTSLVREPGYVSDERRPRCCHMVHAHEHREVRVRPVVGVRGATGLAKGVVGGEHLPATEPDLVLRHGSSVERASRAREEGELPSIGTSSAIRVVLLERGFEGSDSAARAGNPVERETPRRVQLHEDLERPLQPSHRTSEYHGDRKKSPPARSRVLHSLIGIRGSKDPYGLDGLRRDLVPALGIQGTAEVRRRGQEDRKAPEQRVRPWSRFARLSAGTRFARALPTVKSHPRLIAKSQSSLFHR